MNLPAVIIPIPGDWDLAVVDLDDLIGYLAAGDSLEEAVLNAAFDNIDMPREDRLRDLTDRLRQLNATGDANAYWGFDREQPER